jgi:hypothetical protein
MTKDKALDLALDALESERPYLGPMPSKTVKAITAIKQALAAQQEHEPENEPFVSLASVQEPVATVIKKGADRQWMSERLGSLPDGIYSLYTTPPAAQPAPVQPVAWMVWGDNNVPSFTFAKPADKYVFDALYNTPPAAQRQWVGLSKKERSHVVTHNAPSFFDIAAAIEAKLKEKNT